MALARLRVQDVDFNYGILRIGNGKGGKHWQVTLAPQLHASLRRHMEFMRQFFLQDLADARFAGVWWPDALGRKYPKAPKEFGWQFLIGAARLSRDFMALGEVCLSSPDKTEAQAADVGI
jgi:integrase